MKKGFFISVEGPDGSGKGTIISKMKEYFEENNLNYISTKEPGSPESKTCQMLRDLVLNPTYNIDKEAEIFLFMADRCQHVNEVIIPSLNDGKIIICDRYIDSTYAYQGFGRRFGNEKDMKKIRRLNKYSTSGIVPDLTIILLVIPEEGKRRLNKDSEVSEFDEKLDRIEKENLEFHKRVHEGYIDIVNKYSKKRNIYSIDTTNKSKEDCWTEILPIINSEIKLWRFKNESR